MNRIPKNQVFFYAFHPTFFSRLNLHFVPRSCQRLSRELRCCGVVPSFLSFAVAGTTSPMSEELRRSESGDGWGFLTLPGHRWGAHTHLIYHLREPGIGPLDAWDGATVPYNEAMVQKRQDLCEGFLQVCQGLQVRCPSLEDTWLKTSC